MDTSKNIKLLVGAVVVVLAAVGVWAFVAGRGEKPEVTQTQVEENLEQISPDEIGLVLSARSDKRAVKFTINKPQGITGVEYELSYMAAGDIPRGVIGNIEVKEGSRTIESQYLDLGSCSASVCKYDEGVSSVKLILKITKSDGKVFQTQKELEL